MKVKINFTVDIDAEAWAREYGVPMNEVRTDVNRYVSHGMYDHLYRELGMEKTVIERNGTKSDRTQLA